MTINRYIELLNGYLTRSGEARTNYATANHHYLIGSTITYAGDVIMTIRRQIETTE